MIPVLMLLAVTGCVQESPLSDIDLDDPSVIKPDIEINKNIYTSSVGYTTTAWLFDKNGNTIELQSGDVRMNDIKMKVSRGVNGEPYYQLGWEVLSYLTNTNYTCKITLSDSQSYTARITTREKNLNRFTVPSEHNKNNDLVIYWGETVNNEKLILTMSLYGKTDSSNYIHTKEIQITNTSPGNFTILGDYFNNPGYYKANITLAAVKTGEISKSFMNGSKITSTISITREIKLE
jgi:hypothetical protein